MATTVEIIYKIKERDSSFNVTDDYKISDELILSMMNDNRASLIREEYNKNRILDPMFFQFNCCYKIECVEGGCTIDGEYIPDGENVYQVNLKPHVTGIGGNGISYIGNKTGTIRFDLLSFDDYSTMEGRVWTKEALSSTLLGDKLLLKNLPTKGFSFICLREILLDPTTACTWDDNITEYPVPSVKKLINMVVYEIMTGSRLPSDKINNATDDTTAPKIQDQAIAQQQRLQTSGEQNRRR